MWNALAATITLAALSLGQAGPAAPVVSGVAALLMAYFPELTAAQVKALLVETARRFPSLDVEPPGGGAKVPFAKLSASGGVIDAYAAVKAALEREIRK